MSTETPVKKPRATRSRKTTKTKAILSEEQIRTMIAEAAYYRAEQRGFNGGSDDATHDWLEAEVEITKNHAAVN